MTPSADKHRLSSTPSSLPSKTVSIAPSPGEDLSELVEEARSDIAALIRNDRRLAPKFVRLGFHDCVGGCNGCVDSTNHDNNGLEVPITALRPIVQTYANSFTRADIWAMASLVGAEVSQPNNNDYRSFSMEWIGRRTCDSPEMQGPAESLPSSNVNTMQLVDFFSNEFGFSAEETVAIMGAHTLGVLTRENSGFPGPAGWIDDRFRLDHDYYRGLVRLGWGNDQQNNNDLPGIPNQNFWDRRVSIEILISFIY